MEKVLLSGLGDFAQKILEKIQSLDSTRDSSDASGKQAFILALRGELGAGKTTFVQALARELGVSDHVQSPTYVLMKSYSISFGRFEKLVHIDAYRLDDPEEFKTLKPEAFLNDSKNLVVLEWPERLGDLLQPPNLVISFSSEGTSEDERFVESN